MSFNSTIKISLSHLGDLDRVVEPTPAQFLENAQISSSVLYTAATWFSCLTSLFSVREISKLPEVTDPYFIAYKRLRKLSNKQLQAIEDIAKIHDRDTSPALKDFGAPLKIRTFGLAA